MEEVNGKFLILDREPMEELSERLLKRRSPEVVVIDSFQYTGLTYATYKALKEKHPNKLLIFVSHAEGMNPEGRAAKKVAYDADVKIFVQGLGQSAKDGLLRHPVIIILFGKKVPPSIMQINKSLKLDIMSGINKQVVLVPPSHMQKAEIENFCKSGIYM